MDGKSGKSATSDKYSGCMSRDEAVEVNGVVMSLTKALVTGIGFKVFRCMALIRR